ncbi:MAG TPA: hypothetical protein VGI18_10310 [Burkholderiales bacterium]
MRKLVACGLAACAVAGCASAEDPGEALAAEKRPSARLHIEHIGRADHVEVRLLRGPMKECQVGDAAVLASFGSLRQTQDVSIAAERPVTLDISSAMPAVRCEFRARFTPAAGAQYRLVYRTLAGGCALSLEKRQDGGWNAEPYADPDPQCDSRPAGAK